MLAKNSKIFTLVIWVCAHVPHRNSWLGASLSGTWIYAGYPSCTKFPVVRLLSSPHGKDPLEIQPHSTYPTPDYLLTDAGALSEHDEHYEQAWLGCPRTPCSFLSQEIPMVETRQEEWTIGSTCTLWEPKACLVDSEALLVIPG